MIKALPEDLLRIKKLKLSLAKSANYQLTTLSTGGSLDRLQIDGYLNGSKAKASIKSFILGKKSHQHDIVIKMTHAASLTESEQILKTALYDKALSSFFSLVKVPPNCQKIISKQLNKNLLLSDQAQAFSRPELAVDADDVICNHGAATGGLDREMLFYLRNRGLSKDQAKTVLLKAFASSLFNQLDEDLHQLFTQALKELT